MERQEAQRKVLRIDDQTDETSGGAPQRPTTRNAIAGQRSGGPVPPEQKFAASYNRMKQIKEQTQEEITVPQTPQVPTEPLAVEVPRPQPVQIQPVQTQQLQADLSLLATTGRIEEEVVVGGFKFKLASLTSGEQDDVVSAVSLVSGDDLVKLGQLRLQILARAIRSVNGVPLENLYQGPDKHPEGVSIRAVEKRMVILRSWQLAFTVKLFDEYSKVLERSEKAFEVASEDGELLKN